MRSTKSLTACKTTANTARVKAHAAHDAIVARDIKIVEALYDGWTKAEIARACEVSYYVVWNVLRQQYR